MSNEPSGIRPEPPRVALSRPAQLLAEAAGLLPDRPNEAWDLAIKAIDPSLPLTQAQKLLRFLKRAGEGRTTARRKKIAVLGSFSTQHLAELISLYCLGWGLEIEVYEADYGVMHQEILDPGSGLHAFGPELIYLAVSHRSLGAAPSLNADPAAAQAAARAEARSWIDLATSAYTQFHCPVIQDLFAAPPLRILGNHEMRYPASFGRYLATINAILEDESPLHVTIHDVEFLASLAGRWNWFDDRFYFHAKLPCAPDCLPNYAHSVASIIAALSGKAKKCLILDLDNTLWGGVIGDDGLAGIRLGQGEAEAEAFQAFQRYAKALCERGVILAVCSKNDERICKEAFEHHPGMVLKLQDIACFVANWHHKHENIQEIARTLEIGLDAMVFVDDNPAEREIVRRYLPQVSVPELPEDSAGYAGAVDRQRYFQPLSLGREDLRRAEMYQANVERRQAEQASTNVEDFLHSLAMRARIEPIQAGNLERVAQLIARSNQFNLTTRRRSAAELGALTADPNAVTWTVSLADRLGDNGLISVIIAMVSERRLIIDTWIMSCRVLRRGVESLVMNLLVAEATRQGLTEIVGDYIPTPKNGLVAQHYRDLGFALLSQDPDGRSRWSCPLPIANELNHHIVVETTL